MAGVDENIGFCPGPDSPQEFLKSLRLFKWLPTGDRYPVGLVKR
jgi:hypothetical protein